MTDAAFYHPMAASRCKLVGNVNNLKDGDKSYGGTIEKGNYDHIFIDKRGRPRSINPKKLSRKKGSISFSKNLHLSSSIRSALVMSNEKGMRVLE